MPEEVLLYCSKVLGSKKSALIEKKKYYDSRNEGRSLGKTGKGGKGLAPWLSWLRAPGVQPFGLRWMRTGVKEEDGCQGE